jgi:hypothetical protein
MAERTQSPAYAALRASSRRLPLFIEQGGRPSLPAHYVEHGIALDNAGASGRSTIPGLPHWPSRRRQSLHSSPISL